MKTATSKEYLTMQRLSIMILIACVFSVATGYAIPLDAKKEAFGIDWADITPADVANIDVHTRDDDYNATPLHYAAEKSDSATLIALIDAGADVNARDDNGWTALMYAVRVWRSSAVITALIDAGADVNARDDEDLTPLMVAMITIDGPCQCTHINTGWSRGECERSLWLDAIDGCGACGNPCQYNRIDTGWSRGECEKY